MRQIAVENGRDTQDIKVFPQITPILGRTLEEARAKFRHYKSMADYKGGMAKLSSFINVDLFTYPLDEPLLFSENFSPRLRPFTAGKESPTVAGASSFASCFATLMRSIKIPPIPSPFVFISSS